MSLTPSSTCWDVLKKSIKAKKFKEIDTTKPTFRQVPIPFRLRWSFGVNMQTPVLNLTDRSEDFHCIFYSVSHIGILFDYKYKKMKLFQGHQKCISCIAADVHGRWIITADSGNDSLLIVWSITQNLPIHCIFEPHGEFGAHLVQFSLDSRYVVTVGKEMKPKISVWKWTDGKQRPNASYVAKQSFGIALSIRFSFDSNEHFMITFEKAVLFLTWDGEKLQATLPKCSDRSHIGHFTDSTYVKNRHECVSATEYGYVAFWGLAVHTVPFETCPPSNQKMFIKSVKVQDVCISVITSVEELIVIGDTNGEIKFYNSQMMLLKEFSGFKLSAIKTISFAPKGKGKQAYTTPLVSPSQSEVSIVGEDDHDLDTIDSGHSEEIPGTFKSTVILDEQGKISLVDFKNKRCQVLNDRSEAAITAIDTHEEKTIICVGNSEGRVALYDYATKDFLIDYVIESPEDSEFYIGVSALKFCPQGLFLACGLDNGDLWFLDPNVLTPTYETAFNFTGEEISRICFSEDSKFMAFYDDESTVCLYKYICEETKWSFYGKYRSHYKRITDIMFVQDGVTRLFTIGEDRFLVEYDLPNSSPENLLLKNRDRIEQSAIPQCFVFYPPVSSSKERFIYLADHTYKYKKISAETYMCRGTYLGPTFGSCLKKMKILRSEGSESYMVFCTDRYVGLQKLPGEGNPFRSVGMVGHPNKIQDMCISCDQQYLFTIGMNDNSILMWEISTESVDIMEQNGGTQLQPYYCLLEGGESGWLFQEMQDLFYYMQILFQGENTPVPRTVSDKILISELPDLMRSLGFYPSQYEIENMIVELKYQNFETTNMLEEFVAFDEFVKLYLNHRPASGITVDELKQAFLLSPGEPSFISVGRQDWIDGLCNGGEEIPKGYLQMLLSILTNCEEADEEANEDEFFFLPEEISFDYFLQNILGIDMSEHSVGSEQDDNDERMIGNEDEDVVTNSSL